MTTKVKARVRMLVSIAGVEDKAHEQPDFCYDSGQVVEVHPALASTWLKVGHAEKVPQDEPLTMTTESHVNESLTGLRFLAALGFAAKSRMRRRRMAELGHLVG